LTNLVNRAEFERRLQRVLEQSWERGTRHAVLYLDLDQFKIINDTCGHIAGDALLKQLSGELKEQVRDSDTLARLGGDEFGVLLENCSPEAAYQIADNLLKAVKSFRFTWQGVEHKISTSIGFIEINAAQKGVDEILSAIDVACFTAKDLGRGRIKVYEAQDTELSQREGEMHWVTRLNNALAEDKFELYKQNIVALNSHGAGTERWEFLLRLKSDNGEMLLPSDFIPAAERFNLMPKIDRWVIKHAFSYLNELFSHRRMHADPGMFFINLSGASLSDASFYAFIREQLRHFNLPPQMICFEITETAAISQINKAVEFIKKIRQGGCRIALDDFGSGLSTFAYLKSFPVDYVKIDGGFVSNMVNEPMDCAIVEAIQHVAHLSGIRTIAEIVEQREAITKLRDIGVDYMQGYSIEMPQPIEHEFVSLNSA
jgi:diguanylate cyclase (GGDEF)-like protein